MDEDKINGVEFTMHLQEAIENSISPIKDGITKIESSIDTMTRDINDMKLSSGLQKKDIDLIKEQLNAQKMTLDALKDRLTTTEVTLNRKITEIDQRDVKRKASFVDKLSDGFLKKLGSVLLFICILGLCILLGIDYHNVISNLPK